MKLLKFSRPGCNPCFRLAGYLNEKGVHAQELNVYDEKDAEIANKYHIQSVPVLLLLDDNDEVLDQVLGFSETEVDQLLSKL